jgi:hypothetical protein
MPVYAGRSSTRYVSAIVSFWEVLVIVPHVMLVYVITVVPFLYVIKVKLCKYKNATCTYYRKHVYMKHSFQCVRFYLHEQLIVCWKG